LTDKGFEIQEKQNLTGLGITFSSSIHEKEGSEVWREGRFMWFCPICPSLLIFVLHGGLEGGGMYWTGMRCLASSHQDFPPLNQPRPDIKISFRSPHPATAGRVMNSTPKFKA